MSGRVNGIQKIRSKTIEILNTDPELRTSADIHFTYGLMRQHNKFFESKYCAGWSTLQLVDLCRFFTFQKIHSIGSVVKVNQTGSTMFIILRGAARVMAEHMDPEFGRMKLVYEEDLCAGMVMYCIAWDMWCISVFIVYVVYRYISVYSVYT